MFGLNNKVIVVTGGSRGIGKAVVDILTDLKAKVVYISIENLREANQYTSDVRDYKEMEKTLLNIEKEVGEIYGIVCCAGITEDGFFHKNSPESWSNVLDVNLTGTYNTIHPIINKLHERKQGSIVMISSIVGEEGNIGQTNYAASKAGIMGLCKSLAKESARYNIRVNVVAPGFTNTDMTSDLPEKVVEKITQKIPLGRFASPNEIAWGVVYLLSPTMSSYITGQTISINGGQYM